MLQPIRPSELDRTWSRVPGPSNLKNWLAGCSRAIDALVYPTECPVCRAPSSPEVFCGACREELVNASGATCERCAMPVGPWANTSGGCGECRGRSLGFDSAIALGSYQGP